jgi:S-DNA-T family DNA segregation ATPase FtsK/SpoIIIE
MKYSRFDLIFKNLKLGVNESYPVLKSQTKKESSVLYEFTLPIGLSVEEVEKNKPAIRQAIGKNIDIRYGYKNLLIEVYEDCPTDYDYKIEQIRGRVGLLIGYDRNGKLVNADLASGEPHLLIAGETGSGKSTVLRSIITNLILTSDCELFLVDLKRGAEFNVFQKSSRVKEFARTRGEAEKLLKRMSAEIDRRYDLLYENDCVDIKQYNGKFKNKLKYQVLIVDEFADLMHQDKSISIIEELAAKARACGIHMILSTQRPDSQVLNGRIKANVTSVLGLKSLNEINSKIIIGHDGLEKLRGHGHAILKRVEEIELQCPFLDIQRAQELIRYTYIDKKQDEEKTGVVEGFDFFSNLG